MLIAPSATAESSLPSRDATTDKERSIQGTSHRQLLPFQSLLEENTVYAETEDEFDARGDAILPWMTSWVDENRIDISSANGKGPIDILR